MPVLNSLAALHDEMTAWRRDLHANPEVGFAVTRTAGFVAERLCAWGVEVHEGVGGTGVVGVVRGRGPGGSVGLRADMDALPMTEETGLPHASTCAGRMHGCGHDGHTAMLLGAARHLAETRNFDGTVHLFFQPAEVAAEVLGRGAVDVDPPPIMGGEDFAYMLEARPGCFLFLGQGDADHRHQVHHPLYDFNDAILPLGASLFVRLVEKALPRSA